MPWLKQKCLGHIIKDLAVRARENRGGAVRFPRRALEVLRAAIALKRRLPELSEHGYRVACGRIEARLDRLLEADVRHADNRRLAERMRKHREFLTPFLYLPALEPTNNRAERDLRPAVIARKLSAGNRTERGAEAYAVLASVQQTTRKHGLDYLELAVERLRAWRRATGPIWRPGRSP
jgi:hypothetical protein